MKILNKITVCIFIILGISTLRHYFNFGIDVEPGPENLAKIMSVLLILSTAIIILQFVGIIMAIILKRMKCLTRSTLVIILLSAFITSFKGVDSIILNSLFLISLYFVRPKKVNAK